MLLHELNTININSKIEFQHFLFLLGASPPYINKVIVLLLIVELFAFINFVFVFCFFFYQFDNIINVLVCSTIKMALCIAYGSIDEIYRWFDERTDWMLTIMATMSIQFKAIVTIEYKGCNEMKNWNDDDDTSKKKG